MQVVIGACLKKQKNQTLFGAALICGGDAELRTLRLCDMHNVPCATNLASAEMLILGLQRGDLDWRMMIKAKKLH